MLPLVNTSRIGRVLRAVRLHQGLSQRAVAKRARISQSVYSRAERGDLGGMTLGSLDSLAEALGASIHLDVRYRGGLGDRLTDASHARLVDLVVSVLRRAGWLVQLEFGFSVYGERGSVDILAWHLATRTLLVIEVKSRFTDLQAMLQSLARKLRLVPAVARAELHWDAAFVARVVVAYASHGNRSVISRHAAMFEAALPARSVAIRRWLRAPSGPIAGVWLVSPEALERRNRRSNPG